MALTQKITAARIYKDLDMSFTKNSLSGDINKKLDVNAVKQSLRNLIMSKPYERPFHPELGSRIYGMLFENMRPGMETSISHGIQQHLINWEPRLETVDIKVRPDYDHNGYDVTIKFFVKGINEPQDLTVSLTRLR